MARVKGRRGETNKPAALHPPLFYSLHALAHTVRSFQRYEDQLCTLLNEVQTSGGLAPKARRELREVLEELPSATYVRDIEAVYTALQRASVPSQSQQKPETTPAKRQRTPPSNQIIKSSKAKQKA